MKAAEIFAKVTDQIIASIEAGIADPAAWSPPWRTGAAFGLPRNASTGKAYQGGNILVLWMTQEAYGYESSEWATYKQWSAMGAQVRKGEHGVALVKWSPIRCKDHAASERCPKCGRLVPFGFTVFNAAQVEGYVAPEAPTPLSDEERVEAAEAWLAGLVDDAGLDLRHAPGQAFYAPVVDYVSVPPFGDFTDGASYYATVAHEVIHWTGHESRTNRTFGKRFGDDTYAAEELVAEIGSAFLAAVLGIAPEAPRPDHAQYLAHWLKVLRAEPQALFDAASKASKAVEWLSAAVAPEAGKEVAA